MREYDLFIDGKHVPASRSQTVTTHDPVSGEVVSVVARASERDARRAVEAARHAADASGWTDVPARERAARLRGVIDLLYERQPEIADLDVAEAGVPIRAAYELAAGALAAARETIDRAAAARGVEAHESTLTLRRPFGVAAIAPPYDAPFARAVAAIVPPLLAGNTVVLKPGRAACSSAMEIAAAFHESDVPPGVFNALSGAGREVDDELAQNANVDVLSYAGMPADLRRVAERAARTLKRSMFDAAVGGTAIVLEDADLDATIAGISWGAFALAGRVWRRCARVVVSRAIADPVAYHLARTAAALRVGGPGSFETDIGPQASTDAAAASARAVRRAVEAGAVAATPPLQPPGPAFAMPAVLRAFPDSPVAWDELPGPALLVVTVNDAAEAIEIANRPPSRAAASVWSRDLPRALAVARRLAADVLWVNDHVPTRRVGDGIAFEDADGLERRSPVGVARAGSLRDKPWLATLGLDRVLGA